MKHFIVVLLLGFLLLTGCEEEVTTDYSQYLFTDITWMRDNGHDIETIVFHADGSFRYSCACGNPVNDSDLCERYVYNDKTQEIKLDYLEATEDTVTTIKIVALDEDLLTLDFNGDLRKFEKET